MDLIQDSGKPLYGRFEELPDSISLKRYLDYRVDGFKPKWQLKLKYQKIKCCVIEHEHYSLSIVLADVGWASHGFYLIFDHLNHQSSLWQARQIFARKTWVDEQPRFNQSYFFKSPFELHIDHAHGVRYIRISKHGEIKLSARIFCAGTAHLSRCIPSGRKGWRYSQKKAALAVEGYFIDQANQMIKFDAQSLAFIEDRCGFFEAEQTYHVLHCTFWDAKGQRIGMNLSSCIKQGFGNENYLWINGGLCPLPDVLFKPLAANRWQIYSMDGTLQLDVQIGKQRYGQMNLKMTGSLLTQSQVKVTGHIQIDSSEIIEVNQKYALLEQYIIKS